MSGGLKVPALSVKDMASLVALTLPMLAAVLAINTTSHVPTCTNDDERMFYLSPFEEEPKDRSPKQIRL